MKIVDAVKKHGGPCITAANVDELLSKQARNKDKVDIVKNEIRYLKTVLGVVDKCLAFGNNVKSDLETNYLTEYLSTAGFMTESSGGGLTSQLHCNQNRSMTLSWLLDDRLM